MAAASTSADLQFVRHAYKAAVMARDSHRARSIVLDALEQGADPFSLDLDVLQPVLVELGERWVEGEVSVAHEHFVTGVTEGVMALLAGRMRKAPANGRLAVVACPPGERHSLGARMLSDFLEADAWEVICLGAGVVARDARQLLDLLRERLPEPGDDE